MSIPTKFHLVSAPTKTGYYFTVELRHKHLDEFPVEPHKQLFKTLYLLDHEVNSSQRYIQFILSSLITYFADHPYCLCYYFDNVDIKYYIYTELF